MEALARDVERYTFQLAATLGIQQRNSRNIARRHLRGIDATSDLGKIGESVWSSVESLQRTVTDTTEQIEEAATTIAEKVADAATDSPDIRLGLSIGELALQAYNPLIATLNRFGLHDEQLVQIVCCGLDTVLMATTQDMRRRGFTPPVVNGLVASATRNPIRREAVRASWLADILASVRSDDMPIPARAKLIRSWTEEPPTGQTNPVRDALYCGALDWDLFEAARRAHTAGRLNLLQNAGHLLIAFGTDELRYVCRDRLLDAEWRLQSREFELLPELQRALAAQANSYLEQKTLAVGSPDIASHERQLREAGLISNAESVVRVETKKDLAPTDAMKALLPDDTSEDVRYHVDKIYTDNSFNEVIVRVGAVKATETSSLLTPFGVAFYVVLSSGAAHMARGAYNSAGTKWVCYEAGPGDVKIHELLLQLLSFDGTEKTDRGRRWFRK